MLLDLTFDPNDDCEVDIEPLWALRQSGDAQRLEIAVNDGDGFIPCQEYQNKCKRTEDAGGNPRWLKKRTVRYRFSPGMTGSD